MGEVKLYLSGPVYNPEEVKSLKYLRDFLKNQNYAVATNESNFIENSLLHGPEKDSQYLQKCMTGFALEYYNIISADICIGVLNGRVPDEATVVKMGIAFASGIPVVLYKYDCRILFPNGDNSMIQGLSGDFSHVKTLKSLKKKIEKKLRKNIEFEINLTGYQKQLYNLGKQIAAIVEKAENQTTTQDFNHIISEVGSEVVNRLITKPNTTVTAQIAGKVYCSGPLFCPAEVRQMKSIASVLEKNGFMTYLPQRDGGEPYVIGSIDNPFAGSPIVKPIVSFLNNALFALDVYEIINCDYFAINLNGRAPDDGAMAELGMAFGAGKPIVLFINDVRKFSQLKVHPTIHAVAGLSSIIMKYEDLPDALCIAGEFLNHFGENDYISNIPSQIKKFYEKGLKWSKRLENKTPPENDMETWNKVKSSN